MHTKRGQIFIIVILLTLLACVVPEPSLFSLPTPTPTPLPFPEFPETTLVTGDLSVVTWSGDPSTWPKKVEVPTDGGYAAIDCDGADQLQVASVNHIAELIPDPSTSNLTAVLSYECASGTVLLVSGAKLAFSVSWENGAVIEYQDFKVNGEIITSAYRFSELEGNVIVHAYDTLH